MTPQSALPADLQSESFTLRQVSLAVRKHWVLAVISATAVTLAVTFYTLGQTRIFRSSTTLQIDPAPPRPLGEDVKAVVDLGTGAYWNNQEYYLTQFKIIQSRRVAAETVRRLGLQRDGAFIANLPPGSGVAPAEIDVEAAASLLRGRLVVEPIKDSRLVVVSYDDADPVRSQRVLSTLVEVYIEQNIDDALDSTRSAGDWLRTQLEKLKKELEESELALHKYKKSNQILSVSLDDQSNMLRGEMTQLNDELTRVRALAEQAAARNAELAKVSPRDPENLPATELLSSSLLQALRGEYVMAKRQREGLVSGGKGAQYPTVKSADASVRVARRALLREVRNIQRAAKKDLVALKRQSAGLSRLFEQAKTRAMDLNLLEIEYRRLERSKVNTEKLYGVVLERSKESDLTRMMRFNNIHVIDSALVPKAPIRPRAPLNIALGVLGGLVLGLGLALGRDFLDRSIKSPEDAEQALALSFLGLLPNVAPGAESGYGSRRGRRRRSAVGASLADELVVHTQPTSGAAEAARAIRTNLMFMSPDNPHKTLLVTSAAPAEGKTTVACAIAIAMAQAGQRVLLVDGDLRRPRMHRIFHRSNDVGLTSAALDLSLLDPDELRTDIPNLSVLPSGPHAPNPAELLQSERFSRLLERLQALYDRIVIDSPPIVPVTDAVVLSRRVDGTVLVVRAFRTSRDLARQGVRAIRDVGAPVVGAVLNAVDVGRGDYKYYYYRYQYYGRTYGDARAAEAGGSSD